MKLNAQLDVDVLALQQDEHVTCLLTLEAPALAEDAARPGEKLMIVVDRSGSMHGEPLDAVRSSLHALVDRLRPQDTFGVVSFDNEARIEVPTRLMSDHNRELVHLQIDGIQPGGSTDIGAGLLLGLTQLKGAPGTGSSSLLLLSDGHANAGIVDAAQLGGIASSALAGGIGIGTIGIGEGYDETLLAEIASQGNGAHRFALTPDDAAAVLAEEAGDLLSKSIINAFVRITPMDQSLMGNIGLLHDVAFHVDTDGEGRHHVIVPLGDLYSGSSRELLVQFRVPGVAALGVHHLATFTIDYVALPAIESQTITWPVFVNVVPGDEAAGRVVNPTVAVARLLAEVTTVKKQASDALRQGDSVSAVTLMETQATRLTTVARELPEGAPETPSLRLRLYEESEQVEKLANSARTQEASNARKSFVEDITMETRGLNDQTRRERSRRRREF